MTYERMKELEWEWNYCDTWNGDEWIEWWEGLTSEERSLIDTWDFQYSSGLKKMLTEMAE